MYPGANPNKNWRESRLVRNILTVSHSVPSDRIRQNRIKEGPIPSIAFLGFILAKIIEARSALNTFVSNTCETYPYIHIDRVFARKKRLLLINCVLVLDQLP